MTEGPKKMMIESLRRVLQRLHYPIEVMLQARSYSRCSKLIGGFMVIEFG